MFGVEGVGFSSWSTNVRVQGLEFGVQCLWFIVQGLEFSGPGRQFQSSAFMV